MKEITRHISPGVRPVRAALLTLLVLSLSGCAGARDEISDSALSNTEKITFVDYDTDEVCATLEDAEDVADFVEAMEPDAWEVTKLPKGASVTGVVVPSLKPADEALQDTASAKLYEVSEFYVYEDIPYVSVQYRKISVAFRVSDDTAAYLQSFFADGDAEEPEEDAQELSTPETEGADAAEKDAPDAQGQNALSDDAASPDAAVQTLEDAVDAGSAPAEALSPQT